MGIQPAPLWLNMNKASFVSLFQFVTVLSFLTQVSVVGVVLDGEAVHI